MELIAQFIATQICQMRMGPRTKVWDKMSWRADVPQRDYLTNTLAIHPDCPLQHMHAGHWTDTGGIRDVGVLDIREEYVQAWEMENHLQLRNGMTH